MMTRVCIYLHWQVALGKAEDIYLKWDQQQQWKNPEECDSVRAVGTERPDAQFDVTLPTGRCQHSLERNYAIPDSHKDSERI